MARLSPELRNQQLSRTRASLMSAALAEFCAHGPSAANIDRICQTAGLAKGTVYNHFANKDALFLSILEEQSRRHQEFLGSALSAGADPMDRLQRLFRANAGYVQSHLPACRLLAQVAQGIDLDRKGRLGEFYRPLYWQVQEQILAEGVRGGRFPALPLAQTTMLIMTLLLASSSQTDDQGKAFIEPETVVSFIQRSLEHPGDQP